jgi:beta-glucosidase
MNEQTLRPAIEQGKVSVATIDDKVRRILSTAVRFGWLDREQTELSVPRYNPQGRQVALSAAREGITLLKNDGGLLPLSKSKIKSILIIGPNAFPAVPVGGGSAEVQPLAAISYLEGLANYASNHSVNQFQVFYDRGVLSYSDLTKCMLATRKRKFRGRLRS